MTRSPKVPYILGTLVVAAMIMILNETVLSVALPAIMADFGVTADVVQWLATGFLLTMSVVIPTTGFLLQRFSTRANFLGAVGLFTLGTVLCALASQFWVLLAGRVLQASGTAIVLPLLMTATLTLVEPAKQGRMMGINSVVISVAPAIGPTLSGIILNRLTWHWLFWTVVPIAAIALVVGAALMTNFNETAKAPFDAVSVFLSALAFGGVVYGLSTLRRLVDGAIVPLVALAVGLVVLAIFTRRQLRLAPRHHALLDLSPFATRNFTISTIMLMLGLAALLGMVNVLPIYLQRSLLVSTLVTGLALLPGGLLQGAVSPFVGRAYDSLGPRPLIIPGALLMLASMVAAHFCFTADARVAVVIAVHTAFCIGLALVMTPLMTVSLASLPQRLYGHGSAIVNTLQQLGGALGTATMIGVLTITASSPAPADQARGTTAAFVVGCAIALAIAVLSFFVTPARESSSVATKA